MLARYENPLTSQQKIMLGAGVAVVAGVGLYFLLRPRKAKAASRPGGAASPGGGAAGGGAAGGGAGGFSPTHDENHKRLARLGYKHGDLGWFQAQYDLLLDWFKENKDVRGDLPRNRIPGREPPYDGAFTGQTPLSLKRAEEWSKQAMEGDDDVESAAAAWRKMLERTGKMPNGLNAGIPAGSPLDWAD